MFGIIIHKVLCTRAPMNRKFVFVDSINKPPKSHIDYFGIFLFHSVSKEVMGHAILCAGHE